MNRVSGSGYYVRLHVPFISLTRVYKSPAVFEAVFVLSTSNSSGDYAQEQDAHVSGRNLYLEDKIQMQTGNNNQMY